MSTIRCGMVAAEACHFRSAENLCIAGPVACCYREEPSTVATMSDAGKMLALLATQLEKHEAAVSQALRTVLSAQEALSRAIINRDAIQQTLNLTAKFIAEETK